MEEDSVLDQAWLLHLQIPHICPADLVAKCQEPLVEIHGESHEPDLTVLVPDLVDHSYLIFRQLGVSGINLGLLRLLVLSFLIQMARFPAYDCVFTGFGEDEVSKPFAAIHIVPVNVPRGQVGEVTELGGEHFLATLAEIVSVGKLDSLLNGWGVTVPHLQAVVHAAGDDLAAVHVEVRTEHLVPVPLHPSEYHNVVLSLHVPQPKGVVLGH